MVVFALVLVAEQFCGFAPAPTNLILRWREELMPSGIVGLIGMII